LVLVSLKSVFSLLANRELLRVAPTLFYLIPTASRLLCPQHVCGSCG